VVPQCSCRCLARSGRLNHSASLQILLCQNRIRGDEEMTKTLTHEMVHAFDDCRANLDWTDCVHHACTEIRASNVSRECRWLEEFKRLQIHGVNGQKSCVRRRAELSVGMNPFCNKPGQARLAVEAAWETCYRDTAPFENCP
jgi:inner membrane protease ATP23